MKRWIVAILLLVGLGSGMVACDASNFPTIAVQISPLCVVLVPGGTQQFDATLFIDEVQQPGPATPTEVSWSVNGGDVNGVVSINGFYEAPNTVPPPTTQVTIIASSTEDTQKQGQATVILSTTPNPQPNPCSVPPFTLSF